MFVQEMTYPEGTRVLVWRLDEGAQQLLALCREAGIAADDLIELPEKRQREKAAERLLLYHAMGCPVTLSHDPQGAPSVTGLAINVSITHTPHLVAVAINEQQVIGLDAEQMARRQVLRVRDKFLNDNEKRYIAADHLPAHIIASWPDEISLVAHCRGRRYSLMVQAVEDHVMTVACAPVD